MTERFFHMSEDEFDRRFPLLPNHIDCNATWAFGDGPGCLFGNSPEELAFVWSQPAERIWTLLDADEGMCLISGRHIVNRLGYLISTSAVQPDEVIEVLLDPIDGD